MSTVFAVILITFLQLTAFRETTKYLIFSYKEDLIPGLLRQQLLIIVDNIRKIALFKKTKGKGLEITRGEGLVIIS